MITTLVLLGQVLELRARRRTGDATRALLGLAPKTARRVADGGTDHDVALERIAVGDPLRVRPGDEPLLRLRDRERAPPPPRPL